MRFVEIKPLDKGGHRNHTGDFKRLPEGWAVIPDDMETENFPFGNVEVKEIDGVMTVTKWTPGTMPELEPKPIPEATTDEVLNALLGVTDNE